MTSTTTTIATSFSFANDQYTLTVSADKALVTSNWLTAQGCTFDRYISQGACKIVFVSIAQSVVDAIDAKYPLVDEDRYDHEEELTFEVPQYRYCVHTDSTGDYEAFACVSSEGVTLHISTRALNYSAFVAAGDLQMPGATERQVAEAAWSFYVASFAS